MNSTDNIRKRYRHIFILPSIHLLVILTYSTSALVALIVNIIVTAPLLSVVLSMGLAILLLSLTLFTEYSFLKMNPLANPKRLLFLSFASNILLLFLLAISLLLLTFIFLPLEKFTSILILGIFAASCFRLAIFKTLFLNQFHKAILLAFAQPLLIGFVVSYQSLSPFLSYQQPTYVGGIFILASTITFLILLDKKGGKYFGEKPSELMRAFLLAWLAHHPDEFEEIVEKTSPTLTLGTTVLSFEDNNPKPAIIVADAHPGPFYPVGSSNLPYMIHEWFRNHDYSPMILHGVSGHDLNLPSKSEVQRYLSSLNFLRPVVSANSCTQPITKTIGSATVTGIAFEYTALITLTLSPYETEDFPKEVKDQIEQSASSTGFKNIVIIDSHNSEGEKPDANIYIDICEAADQVLRELRASVQFPFKMGVSHSSEFNFPFKPDVGPAGMSVLVLEVDGKLSAIIGVDANNAIPSLRETLIDSSKDSGTRIIELCTSDTHVTISNKGGNSKGYYALGELTNSSVLSDAIQKLKDRAIKQLKCASLTVNITEADVKVMGTKTLDDFSIGLDKSSSFAKKGVFALTIVFFLILFFVGLM